MHWIYLICFTLFGAGLLALFEVRLRDFTDVIFSTTGRKTATLSDELNVLMGTPARGFFNQDYEIKQILKDTGRADRYEAVTRLTLILFAVGAVLALLIDNVYLIPILGIGFSLLPIWYLRSTAASYKKHLNEELGDRHLHRHHFLPPDGRPAALRKGEPALYQRADQGKL